jgi:type VI secretion system protein ImpH
MSLLEDLQDSPEHYTLFAALRRIEQAHRDRPRLGESRKAADDPVRITQRPHLYFVGADIAAFAAGESAVPRVEQHGFGVFGPNGALPLHLTEVAYSREHQSDDPALGDFVNAFQHRFASLFYRAWADSDPCACFDRMDQDAFRLYAGALLGMGPAQARDRDSVLDYAKLARAGLFAPQNKSAEALQQILFEYFELPVELIPFVGSWLDISPDARCRIGIEPQHATLGLGATVGSMTWQCQSRFEIVLGPLQIAEFVNFLPGARGLTQLKSLVRLYTNEEWSWQVRLLLESQQIPTMRLGEGGWLGWTTWLGSRSQLARDAVIEGSEAVATGFSASLQQAMTK